jgi:hypothetical protein
LAHLPREKHHTGNIERALGYLAERLDTLYHFASLVEFKRKFIPSWEPVFLAYAGAANLPRIGYALLRAYLPGISARDVRQLISGISDTGVSENGATPDNSRVPVRAAKNNPPAKCAVGARQGVAPDGVGARLTVAEEWSGERA